MKLVLWFATVLALLTAPAVTMAQEGTADYNHGSVGIFVDYFRFAPNSNSSTTNFVGFGARAGFNANRLLQLEGEMNYDFERNFTTITNNGGTTTFTRTRLRPLTGFFGPKFQTPGPFKFFVTGKVGFINFTQGGAVTTGTVGNAISSVGEGGTHFALYPGAGLEGFWGPFGLRAEVGDAMYFANGTHNDLRVTFGPQFRF